MFYLVALGSNLGDRLAHMQSAVNAFSCLPGTEVVRVSGVYETAPVGCTDDNVYLNAAVLLQSRLAPGEMLGACLGVEASRGRRRPYVNAPRVLDCDLIFAFDGEREVRVNTPNLTLPHPRFLARRFVLQPFFDLFPNGSLFGVCDFLPALEAAKDQQLAPAGCALFLPAAPQNE